MELDQVTCLPVSSLQSVEVVKAVLVSHIPRLRASSAPELFLQKHRRLLAALRLFSGSGAKTSLWNSQLRSGD